MKLVTQLKNIFRPIYIPIVKYCKNYNKRKYINSVIHKYNKLNLVKDIQYIYYFGITAHSNIGDMAQYYCIKSWIYENYPKATLLEFESEIIVDSNLFFISLLKQRIKDNDIIVFQSGYTTQDLGGVHDLMHRIVINNLPNSHILMMPQTIYFREERNKIRTAESYNSAKRMLFLARDKISFEMAKNMFPDIHVSLFPDIVTTLIGKYNIKNDRSGVLLCCRNDGEKLYSNEQILELKQKIEANDTVDISDTTLKVHYKRIRKNIKDYIDNEIVTMSKYKLVITDRYHGTIFSLVAGTPVIVIKTNDHKVETGVDWFKGVFDEYVVLADSLEHAFVLYQQINKSDKLRKNLMPYFNDNYYSKLKEHFELV